MATLNVFRDEGLRIVTVNMDDPNAQKQIQSTLRDYGALATAENFVSQYGNAEIAYEEFQIPAEGLPFLRGFNRFGSQLGNSQESFDIAKQMDALLDWQQAIAPAADVEDAPSPARKLDLLPLEDPPVAADGLPR